MMHVYRLRKPIWTFLPGYFVSTNDTFDLGLETIVFPASDDAHEVETLFRTYAVGIDSENPLEEFTRHYDTVKQAKVGHREVVAKVKEMIKNEHA